MNPLYSPGPPHRHKGTSKPLAVPLGRVGVAIVDDDDTLRLFVRDILDQAREFHCVGSYSNGEAALIGIPQSGAQVVFMDIRMPGMSGIECTRRLKALLPHLIIVMVTEFDDPRTMHLARQCGADQFLPKPFTAAQILATLSFCVPRPKPNVAERAPSGERAQRRGLRGPSPTDRQMRLLEFIAEGLPYEQIADNTGFAEQLKKAGFGV